MKLSDIRHAFVTGGASGIGLGTVRAFAERGIRVTAADANPDSLGDLVAEGNPNIRGAQLNVRDHASWAKAKAEAEAAFGPVDLLFSNAGIVATGYELADMAPELFERVVSVNLFGAFNGISAFASDMRERRHGHIVSTASIVGIAAPKHGVGGSYVASKFAIVGLSEVLRMEMAPHGVGVSVLCPVTSPPEMGGIQSAIPEIQSGLPVLGDTPGGRVEDLVPRLFAGIEAGDFYIISHCEDEWGNVEARSKELEKTFKSATRASGRS